MLLSKEKQALVAAVNAHRRYPETYQEEFELSAKMVAAFLDIYDELSSIANQQAAKQSQSSDSDRDRPSTPKGPKPQFRLPAQAPGFPPTKSVDSTTSEWTATDSIGSSAQSARSVHSEEVDDLLGLSPKKEFVDSQKTIYLDLLDSQKLSPLLSNQFVDSQKIHKRRTSQPEFLDSQRLIESVDDF